MNDEHERPDIDLRVRAALRVDTDSYRRVVVRALAGEGVTPPRTRRGWFAVTAAVLAVLLVFAGLAWRRSANSSASPSLTVTSAGPLVVITSQDGRRWIVGPSTTRRSGNYVLVVTE